MNAQDHSENFSDNLKQVQIGTYHNRPVWLRVPSFDCGWYWGFGYLGNTQCHFHLDGLAAMEPKLSGKNLYDQLVEMFGETLTIPREKLWKFCEIVKTVYTLKEAAALFGLGGSRYTTNPDSDKITITEYSDRINNELIPLQIQSLWRLLTDK